MSRKPTTGRFETREELEREVWDRYHNTNQNIAQIARFARVSATTVSNILDKKGQEPMKNIVVFDLDGTLALIDHRRHLVEGKHKDWPAFFAACVDDEPNIPVIAALHAHRAAGHHVMIVSGRSDEVRAQTEAWLFKHVFTTEAITFAPIMRREGDFTPDDQLKRQWLADGTIPHERVLCAYDDRDKVVQMWRNAGIACFQVAPGEF